MGYDEKIIQRSSNPFKPQNYKNKAVRNIYYGEVVSITDPTDGGRIKVKILDLDNQITNIDDLPYCYPLLPKFFHVYPKVGEMVRVLIENLELSQRGRFWIGSIISQPQKIEYDSVYTALSTTNMGYTVPEPAPSTFPDAIGVFPTKEEIGIVGRVNTDAILRDNQIEFRAGKHENDNVLKLNVKNPASVSLTFEQKPDNDEFYSNTLIMSDKIALISHSGNPKFKAAKIDDKERQRMFEQGHPIARADILVEALNVMRRAIINHIHGYSNLPADKNTIINDLENINFESMLQNNIVTN